MADEKRGSNKGLVILLCLLFVMIVGLGVGLVFVFNRPEASQEEPEPTAQEMYNNYLEDYAECEAKADEMLAQNPVDVKAVIDLFNKYISRYWDESPFWTSTFIDMEIEKLQAGGFDRELLDELVKIDFSVFDDPEQYRKYAKIIQMAYKFGDTEIVDEYMVLADGVKEGFMASCEGTKATMTAYGLEAEDINPLCYEPILESGI